MPNVVDLVSSAGGGGGGGGCLPRNLGSADAMMYAGRCGKMFRFGLEGVPDLRLS
jgi:hypothetical protein